MAPLPRLLLLLPLLLMMMVLLRLLLLLLRLRLLLLSLGVMGTALGCVTSSFRRCSTATAATAGIAGCGCSHAAPRMRGRSLHRHAGCCPPGG